MAGQILFQAYKYLSDRLKNMLLILKSKKVNSTKTEHTISEILKRLEKEKTPAQCQSFADCEIFLEREKVEVLIDGKPVANWSSIFFRNIGKFEVGAYIIAQEAKKNKAVCIDNAYCLTCNQGKLRQTYELARHGLPVPKTYYSPEYSDQHLERAVQHLGWPIVIKVTTTDRGEGVFLADSLEKAKEVLSAIPDKEIILQQFLKNDLDYRILVLGHKIAVAEKRIRTDEKDFRNNVSLGAKEEFFDPKELPKDISDDCEKASRITDIQVAGVDFIISDGQHYFLEINTMPALTEEVEYDALSKYLCQLEKR